MTIKIITIVRLGYNIPLFSGTGGGGDFKNTVGSNIQLRRVDGLAEMRKENAFFTITTQSLLPFSFLHRTSLSPKSFLCLASSSVILLKTAKHFCKLFSRGYDGRVGELPLRYS